MPTIHATPPAAIAYAITRVPPSPIMSPSGTRNPAAAVNVPVILRATSPSAMGDINTTTHAQQVAPSGSGTFSVLASAIQPGGGTDTIDHVVIHVYAGLVPGSLFDDYSNARLVWTSGASSDSETVTMPPFLDHDAPWVGGANGVVENFHRFTSSRLTKPGGGAWTWADVNALTNIGLKVDYALTAGTGGLRVAELWVEVFSALGSGGQVVAPRLKIGSDVQRPLKLTQNPQ